ncbi:MAG: hypothetical protein B7Z16_15095 [Algoriphagus sp. 32-45-6]|nr:MAG: hypothetical protein B7Z16_15095 [Algoriphagus sp. 32-45-6]
MKRSALIRSLLSLAAIALLSFSAMAGNDDLIIRKYAESEANEAISSSWKFSEDFNALIDSYSSFIFRTKKSQEIDQVNFVIEVNSFGKIVGFELNSEADKGLKERLDYVVRQLPSCQPAEGAATYKSEKFEIIIKK